MPDETDEQLCRLAQMAFEGLTVAGSKGSYIFHALGADAQVLDAMSQLMACHAIYLLPGCQQSKGASLEYMVAQQLGLAVYEHAKQDDVLQEQLQQLASKPSLRPEQQPIPA
ncbi:MAG: DUF4406 domain-containing protein [Comamonas sp.]